MAHLCPVLERISVSKLVDADGDWSRPDQDSCWPETGRIAYFGPQKDLLEASGFRNLGNVDRLLGLTRPPSSSLPALRADRR
jgi:hypothetical protein